jgi:amidase
MMLTAMAGSDPADPATQEADAHKTDYTKGLTTDALKGRRIGVIRSFGGYSDTTQPVFDAALEVLKAQGAELVDIPAETFADLGWELRVIEAYDFRPDLEAYLKNAPPAVKSRTLADIIAFEKEDEHEKAHSEDRQEEAQALSRDSDPDYAKLVDFARKRAGDDGFAKAMKDNDVSALVVLAGGPAGLITPDESSPPRPLFPHTVDESAKPSAANLSAASTYPDLAVPAGFVNGLPVDISFIGPRFSEATLFAYGYAYEQASHARKPPEAYKKARTGQ